MIVGLVGCRSLQNSSSEIGTHYNGYEENQETYLGQEIQHYTSLEALHRDINISSTGESPEYLTQIAERLDFASLDKIYLPKGIPESFEIYDIAIGAEYVNISFLHRDNLTSISTRFDAELAQQNYIFTFTRVIYEDPLAGVMEQFGKKEEDLIDGKLLLLKPNSLTWGYNGSMLHLYLPKPPGLELVDMYSVTTDAVLESLGITDRVELLRFTEIEVIYLQD